jgi:hypothetical protein
MNSKKDNYAIDSILEERITMKEDVSTCLIVFSR